MSRLALIYYQGNENFGVVGIETKFKANEKIVKLGDTVSYKTSNGTEYVVVVLMGDRVCLFNDMFSMLGDVELIDVKKPYTELVSGITLNSMRLKVIELKDLN